jgi:hypothetical protein
LVVREEAPFADGDGREGIQAFCERRAMRFVYRDQVEEFEGLEVREVVLAEGLACCLSGVWIVASLSSALRLRLHVTSKLLFFA